MIENQPKFKYILLGSDFIILTISFFMALDKCIPNFWPASKNHLYFFFSHFNLYLIVLIFYIFAFYHSHLYMRNIVLTQYRQFILIVKSLVFGALMSIMFMVVCNVDYFLIYGKKLVLYFSLYNLVMFTLLRALLTKKILIFLAQKNIYQTRVLIVGGDEAAKYVAESLQHDILSNFHIAGFLDDYKAVGKKIYKQFHNLGKLDDLDKVVRDRDVDEILIAINNAPYERMVCIVEKSLETGKVVRIYSDLLRVIAEKMKLEFYSNIPIATLHMNSLDGYARNLKRDLDIILALLAIVILSPLFIAVILGIKLSSKGPVIFKQTRIGKDGRPFEFYKFRSMHMGTDDSRHQEYVKDFIQNGNQGENDDIKIFKITDDPRIFKFGKFIRKTSLDEFPQLLNVIKGDMTLVGPRPCLPYEWECYEEWHKKRLNILPGCTGLWQALGRSSVSFEEMVILDLYYINNISLVLDAEVILATFPVIFFGKGGF
ncbi:sugar transferase [Desulfonema magnum]|uniref:Exopolysaccharide biosynthesis polyprenyl glycosylphosphotransferase n=1 Tax=Desulfonema magnum TaxID=45655 RepID=A0A975GQM1_9BACT|nr:sugar transferase [Desulfonema magnum]QTA90012.1 Exopolysaccharide biosynthesis polyprenyl glycosylphosphotransferase [Desulfonema magnum]